MVSELFYSVVWLVVCTWTGADSLDNETRPNPTHGLSLEHRSVDDSGDIWTPAHTHTRRYTHISHPYTLTNWTTGRRKSMMSWVRSWGGPLATHTRSKTVLELVRMGVGRSLLQSKKISKINWKFLKIYVQICEFLEHSGDKTGFYTDATLLLSLMSYWAFPHVYRPSLTGAISPANNWPVDENAPLKFLHTREQSWRAINRLKVLQTLVTSGVSRDVSP